MPSYQNPSPSFDVHTGTQSNVLFPIERLDAVRSVFVVSHVSHIHFHNVIIRIKLVLVHLKIKFGQKTLPISIKKSKNYRKDIMKILLQNYLFAISQLPDIRLLETVLWATILSLGVDTYS